MPTAPSLPEVRRRLRSVDVSRHQLLCYRGSPLHEDPARVRRHLRAIYRAKRAAWVGWTGWYGVSPRDAVRLLRDYYRGAPETAVLLALREYARSARREVAA